MSAQPSVFGLPPAVATPQASADTLEQVRSLTAFGALKAVVGSEHLFFRVTKETILIPGVKDKDGNPKKKEVEKTETYSRTVRAIGPYRALPKRWIVLGTDIEAENENDLLAELYATHGGPEELKKQGKRFVYCAELLTEVEVHSVVPNEFGIPMPVTVKELALVSDRSPND